MRRMLLLFAAICTLGAVQLHAQQPRFHVLAFYSNHEEPDHVAFAHQALTYFSALAKKDNFDWQTTTDWQKMSLATLKQYQLVIWLDASPAVPAQRSAFQQYMEQGGGWLGFHISGYNDDSTHWPWFVHFLGTVFYSNSWPPLPAVLRIDDRIHSSRAYPRRICRRPTSGTSGSPIRAAIMTSRFCSRWTRRTIPSA
jgi:hypothetical protein